MKNSFVIGWLDHPALGIGILVTKKPIRYRGRYNRKFRQEKKIIIKDICGRLGYPRERLSFVDEVKEIECAISK